jgi:hypothetical protein
MMTARGGCDVSLAADRRRDVASCFFHRAIGVPPALEISTKI